jgi:iron uptake system component EfeO
VNRRELLMVSLAGGAGLAAAGRALAGAEAPSGRRAAEEPPELAAAVAAGVAYFQRRCRDQAPLVRAMRAAIESGDLARARRAYVAARPPYEEIETLAASFEESDRDIDARPYAFVDGEQAEEFRGFHKIELLLFGCEDVGAAAPYAAQLEQSVERLDRELREPERFSATSHFDGMIALATEVAAKKISSEEETWSDQSLLIFRHNWIGVRSQVEPFASVLSGKTAQRVLRACDAADELVAPYFPDGAAAAAPYSDVAMRQRRAIADASNRIRDGLLEARTALGV